MVPISILSISASGGVEASVSIRPRHADVKPNADADDVELDGTNFDTVDIGIGWSRSQCLNSSSSCGCEAARGRGRCRTRWYQVRYCRYRHRVESKPVSQFVLVMRM